MKEQKNLKSLLAALACLGEVSGGDEYENADGETAVSDITFTGDTYEACILMDDYGGAYPLDGICEVCGITVLYKDGYRVWGNWYACR